MRGTKTETLRERNLEKNDAETPSPRQRLGGEEIRSDAPKHLTDTRPGPRTEVERRGCWGVSFSAGSGLQRGRT